MQTFPLVLVSACLLGSRVRYDGSHRRSGDAVLERWLREGCVVSVCPEVAGGLPVPRPAAEVVDFARSSAGASHSEDSAGARVLLGQARVVDAKGHDWSSAFVVGAQEALREALHRGIRMAVLKEGSPSCGSSQIYDGTFSATRTEGQGVTAALLRGAGIRVFSEAQWAQADACLMQLQNGTLEG